MASAARPARSQALIVDAYTAIAAAYCAASTVLFLTVANSPLLAAVHFGACVAVLGNRLVLAATKDLELASHVILAVGTVVVSSLFATGGWEGTGAYWTFAYLPYAFFLARRPVAAAWVAILVAVDTGLLVTAVVRHAALPYSDVHLTIFAASLAVFLLCMFLFQAAALRSEAIARKLAAEMEVANDRLRASEAELDQANRMAGLGSFTWRPATDAVTWSREMRTHFGLPPGSPPYGLATFMDHVEPADRDRIRTALEGAAQGKEVDMLARIRRDDGAARTLHVLAHHRADAEGDLLVGTAQDVTAARQAEEATRKAAVQLEQIANLRELDRLKTRFMNTAAHELATPLTPIRIQMRLLRETSLSGADDPARRAKALDVLERNVERLARLVGELIDGARLQAAGLTLKLETCDLGLLAQEAIARAHAGRGAGHRFATDLDAGIEVRADRARLAQAIDCLLDNAAKFSAAGAAIRVEVAPADAGARIGVRDEGIGIDPSQVARLFQPFAQVHDRAMAEAGTGLGLFIARGIAEAHGGRLVARSDGLGKGAEFTLTLPLADRPDEAVAQA